MNRPIAIIAFAKASIVNLFLRRILIVAGIVMVLLILFIEAYL